MEGLRAHLRVLEIQRVSIWYTQPTFPGKQWEQTRDSQLQSAHFILFLLSSDFLNSEQCRKIVLSSMERYKKGEVRVIPIILRPVRWQETLFGDFQPLPRNGKPVIDRHWKAPDYAFVDIVRGIKHVIDHEEPAWSTAKEHKEHNDFPFLPDSEEETAAIPDGVVQLEQIIQGLKSLRGQIASAVLLKAPPGFSVASCESQYRRLYGDTMVFLATYLPSVVSDNGEGFVETVYRKASVILHQRTDFAVLLTRRIITSLAELEKLAAQIDACVSTLEHYKQDYLVALSRETNAYVPQSLSAMAKQAEEQAKEKLHLYQDNE